MARLSPRPDVAAPCASSPRRAAPPAPVPSPAVGLRGRRPGASVGRCDDPRTRRARRSRPQTPGLPPEAPGRIRPLAPERYRLQVTIGGQTLQKLRLAKNMLRHAIPSGDEAAILDRALTAAARGRREEEVRRHREPAPGAPANAPRRIAPYPGRGQARGLAARPRPLRVRGTERPSLHRARIPGVPPREALCGGRRGHRRQRPAALSPPQRLRGPGLLRARSLTRSGTSRGSRVSRAFRRSAQARTTTARALPARIAVRPRPRRGPRRGPRPQPRPCPDLEPRSLVGSEGTSATGKGREYQTRRGGMSTPGLEGAERRVHLRHRQKAGLGEARRTSLEDAPEVLDHRPNEGLPAHAPKNTVVTRVAGAPASCSRAGRRRPTSGSQPRRV